MTIPPTAHTLPSVSQPRDVELHPYFEPDVLALVRELDLQQQARSILGMDEGELVAAVCVRQDPVVAALDRMCTLVQGLRDQLTEVDARVTRLANILAGEP